MMNAKMKVPLAVIGAGAGGLVIAIGSAKAGRRPLLIERGPYGGDCTNFGCIPSKALISAGHCAHSMQKLSDFGLRANISAFDGSGAFGRVRGIVKNIRDEEEPPILKDHGVDTLTGTARFIDRHTLEVKLENGDTQLVEAKQIVIATGSRPAPPPILGLDQVPYLTNETIFDLDTVPKNLLIIGGGPIGIELAQALRRLGSRVTVVEFFDRLLFRDEPETSALIEQVLRKEGIDLHLNSNTTQVEYDGSSYTLNLENRDSQQKTSVNGDTLLVAAGRVPNTESLNLNAAGIETIKGGIVVDDYGRTTARNVYAVGDVTGLPPFTHMAEYEARGVLVNLLNPLPWPFKSKLGMQQALPYVTYCDPEIATVGMKEKEACEKYGSDALAIYHVPLSANDRAKTTGRTEGFVKVITKKWSSKILGATIAAPRAGEMIMELGLAIREGIPLRKLSSLIHPYPTYSLAIRKAADGWLQQTVVPSLKKLIGR